MNCKCKAYDDKKYGRVRAYTTACCSGAMCVCGLCPRTLSQAERKLLKDQSRPFKKMTDESIKELLDALNFLFEQKAKPEENWDLISSINYVAFCLMREQEERQKV